MLLSEISTMWPMLLDMTRDDCRRTLRRLELEAYSSMITVFRAQGALLDDRKKLLEELRGALNISNDRHTAEARRVSNDELLATIAEQLSGPNTGLGWICEGRRKVPILPRSIPQTMYTELADQVASIASKENEKNATQKRLVDEVSEKLEKEKSEVGLEGGVEDMEVDETCSPPQDKVDIPHLPVVLYDNSDQIASEDAPPKKRSRQNPASVSPTAASTPQPKATHQRYLNISQIYSNYSKTPLTGKVKSERNYQSNKGHKTPHGPKSMVKRNAHGKHTARNSGQVAIPHHQVRSGIKSPTDPHIPGAQAMNIQTPIDSHHLKSQTSGFQANFAQSIAKKMNLDEAFDIKHNTTQNQQIIDSPTMQLLTQPNVQENVIQPQHENIGDNLNMSNIVSSNATNIDNQASPVKSHSSPASGRPCQFIIKKNKVETCPDSNLSGSSFIQVSNVQVIPPKSDMSGVKVLQNRHVVMTSPNNSIPKVVNSGGKLVTAKFVQQLPPKAQSHLNPNIPKTLSPNMPTDKVIIVSKPVSPTVQSNLLQRTLNRPKNIIISNQGTPLKEGEVNKVVEGETPIKTVLQTPDTKVQPKTFLVNPKSGQKMVVLPAKARSKGSLISQSVPYVQVKGIPGKQTPVKLVPLGSQANDTKSNNITIVSKATSNILTKVISKESLTHINSSSVEGTNTKPGQVHIAPKPKSQAIIRQTGPNTKSNLIVLQKSSLPNKSPITLSKNNNEVSKIVMSNKVNTITTSQSNIDETENNKTTGNVIVLQLTNDQADSSFAQNTGTKDAEQTSEHGIITQDTPVLLHSQITPQVTNSDSLESTNQALLQVVNMENTIKTDNSGDAQQKSIGDEKINQLSDAKQDVSSSVPVWVSSVSSKVTSDKMNLEMEMSSECDMEAYVDSLQDTTNKKGKEDSSENNNVQDNNYAEDVLREHHSSISNVSRTLLSQLQDEGSSSNDSSFLLKSIAKTQIPLQSEVHKEEAAKDSAKQSQLNVEKSSSGGEGKHERPSNRMDIFSTAIASADIHLDSFEYLEDDIISQDEILQLSTTEQTHPRQVQVVVREDKEQACLERQLDQMMEEDHLDDSASMESSCLPAGAIE